MNFAELKARAAELAAQVGYEETNPQPDWSDLINRALVTFSWEAEYNVSEATITTVANQAEYQISSDVNWKRVTDVIYNNQYVLELTDENTIRRLNPNWLIEPSSIPTHYFLVTPNTVRFYPVPLTGSISIKIRGVKADTLLVNDTDTVDVAVIYHEAIALLAAWLHAKRFAQGEDLQRVSAYYSEAMEYAKNCRLFLAEQSQAALQVRSNVPRVERISLNSSPFTRRF